MHRKPLTIESGSPARSGEPEKLARFAIARRPGLARLDRGAFCFPDRDHLLRMRFRQLAPAGVTATRADMREIVADMFLSVR
jgi:hypothetical protein